MSATVTVNNLTVVHATSEGVSIAFPDVCLTPPSSAPVPYINLALSADAADTAATVFADGQPVMIQHSNLSKSVGDEPGLDGGIVSGVNKAKASFTNYSFDVKFEDEPVPRYLDPMGVNEGGVANTLMTGIMQPNHHATNKEILCAAFCACMETGGKGKCMSAMMATRVKNPDGSIPYDPNIPGLYVEPAYNMDDDPPSPYPSQGRSSKWKDADGDPLPLPLGDYPMPKGSRRPDFVAVKDPTLPPTQDNIDKIYEAKFPGDRWRRGQREAYEEITGDASKVEEISEEKCDWCGKEPKRKKIKVPNPSPLALAAMMAMILYRIAQALAQAGAEGI